MSDPTESGRSAALSWEVRKQHGLTTIALAGELDLAAVDALQPICEAAVDGNPVVIIDMEQLAFMDSTGLRVLGALHKRAEQAGCRFLLGRASTAVRRVLHVSGLVEYFEYVEGTPPADKVCPKCELWVAGDADICSHCGTAF
jgi:anti-anti-sigma factor